MTEDSAPYLPSGSLILEAARFADLCHLGQVRKYNPLRPPYIEHPGRVAARVARLGDSTEEMVAAAWLHDVIEDCPVQPWTISQRFGADVLYLVANLTNTTKLSDLPREERKRLDRERLAACSREVKVIKLCDRIDNVVESMSAPRAFAELYLAESHKMAAALAGTHAGLEAELAVALGDLSRSLR